MEEEGDVETDVRWTTIERIVVAILSCIAASEIVHHKIFSNLTFQI